MENVLKCWIFLLLAAGCGTKAPIAQDKTLSPGSPQEMSAIAEVKRLAVQHKYHPEKMNMEIETNPETGDFLIFLFPKPTDSLHLHRELGLFAIVKAKSGQVIRFSDPALRPDK